MNMKNYLNICQNSKSLLGISNRTRKSCLIKKNQNRKLSWHCSFNLQNYHPLLLQVNYNVVALSLYVTGILEQQQLIFSGPGQFWPFYRYLWELGPLSRNWTTFGAANVSIPLIFLQAWFWLLRPKNLPPGISWRHLSWPSGFFSEIFLSFLKQRTIFSRNYNLSQV